MTDKKDTPSNTNLNGSKAQNDPWAFLGGVVAIFFLATVVGFLVFLIPYHGAELIRQSGEPQQICTVEFDNLQTIVVITGPGAKGSCESFANYNDIGSGEQTVHVVDVDMSLDVTKYAGIESDCARSIWGITVRVFSTDPENIPSNEDTRNMCQTVQNATW